MSWTRCVGEQKHLCEGHIGQENGFSVLLEHVIRDALLHIRGYGAVYTIN